MTTVRAETLADVRYVAHGVALVSTKDSGVVTILMWNLGVGGGCQTGREQRAVPG